MAAKRRLESACRQGVNIQLPLPEALRRPSSSLPAQSTHAVTDVAHQNTKRLSLSAMGFRCADDRDDWKIGRSAGVWLITGLPGRRV